jgi:hypothetical protein
MTTKKTVNNKKVSVGAIAAGIVGVTAAAVGTYYLYGHKNATKHRAMAKSWMLKAKGEVLEKLEQAQEVTEPIYNKAVDAVAAKYNELKSIDPEELSAFLSDMKKYWSDIQSGGRKHAKKPRKAKKA